MLIADQQQVAQTTIGQEQNSLTRTFQQCVGGNGGTKTQFLDQAWIDRLFGSKPHQLTHGSHGRIPRHIRLLGEHFAYQQLTCRMTCHHIGERASAINPELPAFQDSSGRWALAASSTQRCTLEWS